MLIKSKKLLSKKYSQRGFSMIEVLISILVMSFGLLGIGGMMMSGVNNTTGSDLSSRATQSANQIMDAMRANSNAATSNLYLWPNWGGDINTLSGTSTENIDRTQWLNTIRTLPAGDGIITANGAIPNSYIITIRFRNCLGSLNLTQQTSCANSATTSLRTMQFMFRI